MLPLGLLAAPTSCWQQVQNQIFPLLDIFRSQYINATAMPSSFTRSSLPALVLLAALSVLAGAAHAAELVMFRRDGCPYCAAWDREIGAIYPRTDIARRAPLRIVDLDRGDDAAIRTLGPIIYTPTFVLADSGEELGRIEGYPGDAFFWGLLDRLLQKLPPDSSKGASTASEHAQYLARKEPAL